MFARKLAASAFRTARWGRPWAPLGARARRNKASNTQPLGHAGAAGGNGCGQPGRSAGGRERAGHDASSRTSSASTFHP